MPRTMYYIQWEIKINEQVTKVEIAMKRSRTSTSMTHFAK